ncbi:MAG: cytochrome c [Magnetococcales bacterium]|nr:cytochrome c [Magnetococcales bacterium]
MNRRAPFIFVITLLCLSWVLPVQAEENFTRDSYVNSVITVLRIHKDAILNLTAHDMKYSDNLVRHAIAIQKTFGLLGPMDWHAAESAKLLKRKSTHPDMTVIQFEKLAKQSNNAMKGVIRSAHENMEEDDREGLREALDTMMESCNACHSYLPKSVAPDVWGTLKRK